MDLQTSKKLMNEVKAITDWYKDGYNAYYVVGKELIMKGFSFDHTIKLLKALHSATATEYGD